MLERRGISWQSRAEALRGDAMSLIEKDDADTVGDDGYRREETVRRKAQERSSW